MTRRLSSVLYGGVLFLIALLALWVHFPWEGAARYALARTTPRLAEQGFALLYDDIVVEGRMFPRFTFVNLSLASPLLTLREGRLVVTPHPTASLLERRGVCAVSLSGGDMRMLGGKGAAWRSGSFRLVAGSGGVALEQVDIKGEFAASGYIAVSPATAKITEADLRLKIPAELDPALNALTSILPLAREGSAGEWRVHR